MFKGGMERSPPSLKQRDADSDDESCERLTPTESRENRRQLKENQLIYINTLIKLARAFSIHYYQQSTKWKYAYWSLSGVGVLLTALNTIVNTVLERCSEDNNVSQYNIALGSVITALLTGITVLNAPLKRRENQEAGDKYNETANNLYVEIYCNEMLPKHQDLRAIIDKYVVHLNDLSDRYDEPSPGAIHKILGGDEYKFLINIHNEVV